MTDFLKEQIVHISKSGAFDSLSKSYGELEERYKNVRADLNKVLDEIINTPAEEVIDHPSKIMLRIKDICINSLKTNRP